MIGRTFTAEDDSPDTPLTAILSHGYWQTRFGGNPGVLGDTIIVNGRSREIIGVMPADFRFLNRDPAIWLPFQFNRSEVFFGNFSYQGIGKLKPGVTMEQANADVARMIPLSFDKFPMPPGFTVGMVEEVGFGPNIHPLKEDVIGRVRQVASAAGGFLGLGRRISAAEQEVLDRLEQSFR